MPRGGRVLANGAGVKLAVIISSDGWLWDSTCLLCVGFRTLKRPPFQTLDGSITLRKCSRPGLHNSRRFHPPSQACCHRPMRPPVRRQRQRRIVLGSPVASVPCHYLETFSCNGHVWHALSAHGTMPS